ncbi:MAG: hypothetical protein U1B84_19570, partial [Variovorax sp.]|nr:hypothetical protein [Variovorax sp.]
RCFWREGGAMEEFKVKDEVCLPSNRETPMSIESIDGDIATCVWLDPRKKAQREPFRLDVLERYDNGPIGFETV